MKQIINPVGLKKSEYRQASDYLKYLSFIYFDLLEIDERFDYPRSEYSPKVEDDPIVFLCNTYSMFNREIENSDPKNKGLAIEDRHTKKIELYFRNLNAVSRQNEVDARMAFKIVEPLAVGFYINAIAPNHCEYDYMAQTRPFNPIRDNLLLVSGIENAIVYILATLGPRFIYDVISKIEVVDIDPDLLEQCSDLARNTNHLEDNKLFYDIVRDDDFDTISQALWSHLEELGKEA